LARQNVELKKEYIKCWFGVWSVYAEERDLDINTEEEEVTDLFQAAEFQDRIR